MPYLASVIHDSTDLATPHEQAAIDLFDEQLKADGHWVYAGGLGSPATATVVDNRRGEAMVTDGPFVETKEYLAGPTTRSGRGWSPPWPGGSVTSTAHPPACRPTAIATRRPCSG